MKSHKARKTSYDNSRICQGTPFLVYMLRTALDLRRIKFGITGDLKARLAQIRTSAGAGVEVLATLPCCCEHHARVIEAQIHLTLAPLTCQGREWFQLPDDQIEAFQSGIEALHSVPIHALYDQHEVHRRVLDDSWMVAVIEAVKRFGVILWSVEPVPRSLHPRSRNQWHVLAELAAPYYSHSHHEFFKRDWRRSESNPSAAARVAHLGLAERSRENGYSVYRLTPMGWRMVAQRREEDKLKLDAEILAGETDSLYSTDTGTSTCADCGKPADRDEPVVSFKVSLFPLLYRGCWLHTDCFLARFERICKENRGAAA